MYKSIPSEIKKYTLDPTLHALHKLNSTSANFGMDNTSELLDGGFGLYSTVNTKRSIGPAKTEYYRIGLIRSGTAKYSIGLETFQPVRNTIVFGVPGQVFSLQEPTEDFFAYYMLFSEDFISETLLPGKYRVQYPFIHYEGVQCFQMTEEEGTEIESLFFKINDEIMAQNDDVSRAIQLYIHLILINAGRNYARSFPSASEQSGDSSILFTRFVKLVSKHFLTVQKVSAYADMLYVSADHLNRAIKSYSLKTAHELIDEMITTEAKAYLRYSQYTISEIAYLLNFTDPSHFNKFFKKITNSTPNQYRNKSE
ncbi:MAG: helix-turn-helix domain-containing protein [Ignavibacteria bacterium]|nr:helix-turn-helix domain-containing protein [Ignavibacteria bacterium]